MKLQSINKEASVPNLNFHSLWVDEGERAVYSFGGETSHLPPINAQPVSLAIWKLVLDGKDGRIWKLNTTVTDEPFLSGTLRPVGGSVAQSERHGLYLGGYSSLSSSPATKTLPMGSNIAIPGLITYDFRQRLWSNDSATAYSPLGTAQWGAMHYVPSFGPEGLFVLFGGDASRQSQYVSGASPRKMDSVWVYEPQNKRWYQQATTGDSIPQPRQRMCVVGAQDQGKPAYEM